jgi:hypothetical protein
LLSDLVRADPLSPTGFGLAVHNASAGLFSIARTDRANLAALAAGASTIEHGVIEACSLLADGAAAVLLVAYEQPLPPVFTRFEDCDEQPHAWAWLMVPAGVDAVRLSWAAAPADAPAAAASSQPPGLDILRFHLRGEPLLERVADQRRWQWTRDA